MVNELKYILLGLLLAIVVFGGLVLLTVAIKYFPDATVVVGFLAFIYWGYRIVKAHYED